MAGTLFDAQPRKAHRVSAVTRRLKEILVEASEKAFWVRGHLTSVKKSTAGHVFGELIEVDDRGKTVAKVGVMIWDSEFQEIQRKLGCQGALSDSQEICALCSIRFHEVFGLRLTIFDVDPDFGESHVVRNRRIVLERLRDDGLLDRNRSVTMTAAPLRIGLITADGSAALADFRETILVSPFAFRIVHAPVAIQGEETPRSVREAIERLTQLPIDVICIVRGGGSQVDLAWLDDESIARAVALCPIPVWVGIGHEVDRGVLDVIAHESHKTPTEVAKVLVDRVRTLASRLESAEERLRDICERHSMLADQKLQRTTAGLLQGSRKHCEIHISRFHHLSSQLFEHSRRILAHAAQKLSHQRAGMSAIGRRLDIAAQSLEERARLRDALDPERLLNRGYSLTRDAEGRIVTSVDQVAPETVLRTQLRDGAVVSVVTSVEERADD